MSNRITQSDLEHAVTELNRKTGNPTEYYTGNKANVGAYVISYAYGGCQLQRVTNEHGGVTNITSGYNPKKEVYNVIQGMLKM